MMPILCGFAGSFLASIGRRLAPREAPSFEVDAESPTPTRLAIGAVLATLLLFLAFAGPALDGLCAG